MMSNLVSTLRFSTTYSSSASFATLSQTRQYEFTIYNHLHLSEHIQDAYLFCYADLPAGGPLALRHVRPNNVIYF
jgi:hypothetical protein